MPAPREPHNLRCKQRQMYIQPSRKARQCPSSEGPTPCSLSSLLSQPACISARISKSPTARGDKPRPISCTSCPTRASAMEKGYIVNLQGAWGMFVPWVSLCACIYGWALAGVTCAHACVRARVGMGGGRGWCVKACLCVGRAGVSRHAWIWLGTDGIQVSSLYA